MIKKVSFRNGNKLTLRGFIHFPKKYNTAVIFCHGFPSSSQGRTSPRIGRALEKLGYLVLRFDFDGVNKSDGKFEDKLMSKEVKDIKYAIDFLKKNFKFKKLIIMGHSTGAIDLALYAYRDKRIDKVVLVGGVGNLKQAVRYDFTDEQVRDFWTKGYIVYKKPKEFYHNKKLKKAFYDEFFKLDILGSIKKFKRPLLIIHGEKDEYVPVNKDPYELYKAAKKPKKLVIIKNADHSFTNPRHFKQLIYRINKFIKTK